MAYLFFLIVLVACGSSGDGGQTDNPPPSQSLAIQQSTLTSIEESLLVVVGNQGSIFTSKNHIDWVEQVSGVDTSLNDVVRGKSRFVIVGNDGAILTSLNGVDWIESESGTVSRLNSVTWGYDHYVAVGNSGEIVSSEDGVYWRLVSSGTAHDLNKVIWDGHQFIAVGKGFGNGIVLSSVDGVNWQERRSGGSEFVSLSFNDVVWNGFQYVAAVTVSSTSCIGCGAGYGVYRSVDGVTWSSINIPSTFSASIKGAYSVEWDGVKFIVYGTWHDFSESGSFVATSTDGITWVEKRVSPVYAFQDVNFHEGVWDAVDRNGVIYRSGNGEIWEAEVSLEFVPNALFFSGGSALVTINNAFLFSPVVDQEGLSFSIENKPEWAKFDENTGSIWGVPALSDVGSTVDIVISVSDGVSTLELAPFNLTVTQGIDAAPSISGNPSDEVPHNSLYTFIPESSDGNDDRLFFSIVNKPGWASFNNNNGMLSGTPLYEDVGVFSNVVISAHDGVETVSLPAFDIEVTNGAPFINIGKWVAVGVQGVYTSQDAFSWVHQYENEYIDSASNPLFLHGVAWNGSMFVAIDRREKVFVSHDGVSWVEHAVGNRYNVLNDIIAVGTRFFAIGKSAEEFGEPYYNSVFISENGVDWKKTTIDLGGTITDIEWNGSQFVALGEDSFNFDSRIKTFVSNDGVDWSVNVTDVVGKISDLVWDGSRFVAVGRDIVVSSVDGVEWTIIYTPEEYVPMSKVSWNGERYVTVGVALDRGIWGNTVRNSVIQTSGDGILWEQIALPTAQACFPLPSPPGAGDNWVTCLDQTIPAGLNAISWNGTEFVAMGNGDVARSRDGISWSVHSRESDDYIAGVISTASDKAGQVLTAPVGLPYTLEVFAGDPENDPLFFSAEGLPSWASIDTETGLVSGTPSPESINTTSYITISVDDGYETTSLQVLELIVPL